MSEQSFTAHERTGWERNAIAYDDVDLPATEQAFGPLLDSFGELAGKQLLEVASGTGILARHAINRGAVVTGIDFATNMIALARQNCPEARFQEGNGEALPFEDGAFDAVACSFGLLHMADPERAMREAARVLAPNGRLAFTVWAGPDQGNAFLGAILGTYQEYADMDVGLPPAPPMFALANPAIRDPMLTAAGFDDISARDLAIEWPIKNRAIMVEFIEKGAVRTNMVYERQTPEVQKRIRDVLMSHTDRYIAEGRSGVPCPAVLVTAAKSG